MCTSPNYMIYTGKRSNPFFNGKSKMKLQFVNGKSISKQMLIDNGVPFIEVPCGHCLECHLHYVAQWSARCCLEAKKYKDNYFITLTYSDKDVPCDGELHPEHLEQFMKNIRKKFPNNKIKFFASGEYGSQNFRPHFHIILFNCPLDDLTYEFKMVNINNELEIHRRFPDAHQDLRFSQKIFDAWNKKGMISVGKFSYDTAGYVAQYTMKKCNNAHAQYIKEHNLHPEFLRMSRRPGIGEGACEDVDVLRGDVLVPAGLKSHYASVPRYFEKLFIKKYGDEIFDTSVRLDRYFKKMQNLDEDLAQLKHENQMRDYILKQKYVDKKTL